MVLFKSNSACLLKSKVGLRKISTFINTDFFDKCLLFLETLKVWETKEKYYDSLADNILELYIVLAKVRFTTSKQNLMSSIVELYISCILKWGTI